MNSILKFVFRYPYLYLGLLSFVIFISFTSSSFLKLGFLVKYILFGSSFFLLVFLYYFFLVSLVLNQKPFVNSLSLQSKVRNVIKKIYLNESIIFCLLPALSFVVENIFGKLFLLALFHFFFSLSAALRLKKKLDLSLSFTLAVNFLGLGCICLIGAVAIFNFVVLIV